MGDGDNPAGWVAAIFVVAALMFAYGLWAIRSGYVHVGDRWQRVYRDKEPKSFWFTVVVFTMILPAGIVGAALWELGLLG
jgi:hypothetical protein